MYKVYILLCSDRSLYTGITTDLKRRFEEHKNGEGAHYTRAHKPLRMVYAENATDRSTASKREAQIKQLTHTQKLRLIKMNITT